MKSVSPISQVEVSYHPEEICYWIRHFPHPRILVGYQSGHFSKPAFRWNEIVVIASANARIEGPVSGAECLLLLFPIIYLSTEPVSEVATHLRSALNQIGIAPDKQQPLIDLLIEVSTHQHLEWTCSSSHGWICSGHHSGRDPKSRMSEIPDDGWKTIADFFESLV